MDVILEAADSFVFDRIYANLLPIGQSPYSVFEPISTLAAGLKQYGFENQSWIPSMEAQAGGAVTNGWQWTPASQYISASPSQYAYMSRWPRDNIFRQALSLLVLTWFSANAIYLIFSTLSFIFVFDKRNFNHPKYLKNQMRMEITQALRAIPVMTVLTIPFFLAEVRGHGYMYDSISTAGFDHFALNIFGGWWNWIQFPIFLLFTDFCIYWIHRWLHQPGVYKHLHKPHHKWIMPTPYASIAFHPLDGYAQSLPYHIFPLMLPLQKFAYIALFVFVQIWSVMIHDGEYVANSPIINGAACHTMHHLYFNYNYGQFTTLWDRIGGSYRQPNEELFNRESKMAADEWNRQAKEMEKMVTEVEGKDDRTYGPPDSVAKKTQ